MAEKTTGTVMVANMLPNGIVMETDGFEPITLNGANSARFGEGYGLTEVPADAWAAFSRVYKDIPLLTRRQIFAQPNQREVQAQASEVKDEPTGVSRINPDKPGGGVEKATKD